MTKSVRKRDARRLLVAVILFAGLVIAWRADRHEIIRHASLLTNVPALSDRQSWPRSGGPSPCRRLLLGNHKALPGARTVLVVRRQDHGNPFAVDDNSFENLSLEISDPKTYETIAIPSPRVKLFYSSGGLIWVDNCRGQFGTEAVGLITLKTIGNHFVRAEIDLEVATVDAGSGAGRSAVRFRDAGWYW